MYKSRFNQSQMLAREKKELVIRAINFSSFNYHKDINFELVKSTGSPRKCATRGTEMDRDLIKR